MLWDPGQDTAPNEGMQATAASVRSCLALSKPYFHSGARITLGCRVLPHPPQRVHSAQAQARHTGISAYGWLDYAMIIGKYLSCHSKLDCVIIFKAGFETQLRASPLSISCGMSALGMARQIREGRLQGGIQPDHVSTLQGLDEVA